MFMRWNRLYVVVTLLDVINKYTIDKCFYECKGEIYNIILFITLTLLTQKKKYVCACVYIYMYILSVLRRYLCQVPIKQLETCYNTYKKNVARRTNKWIT